MTIPDHEAVLCDKYRILTNQQWFEVDVLCRVGFLWWKKFKWRRLIDREFGTPFQFETKEEAVSSVKRYITRDKFTIV